MTVYVASRDQARAAKTRTIDVPKAPQEVLVRPDGRIAYISCDVSLSSWTVEKLIDVGPGADGLAWAPASRK